MNPCIRHHAAACVPHTQRQQMRREGPFLVLLTRRKIAPSAARSSCFDVICPVTYWLVVVSTVEPGSILLSSQCPTSSASGQGRSLHSLQRPHKPQQLLYL